MKSKILSAFPMALAMVWAFLATRPGPLGLVFQILLVGQGLLAFAGVTLVKAGVRGLAFPLAITGLMYLSLAITAAATTSSQAGAVAIIFDGTCLLMASVMAFKSKEVSYE